MLCNEQTGTEREANRGGLCYDGGTLMQRVAFQKYQGLGNDFIVIRQEDPDAFDRRHASRLCDRHFGVGADGVLLVTPPVTPGARARMIILNADGSRPEMCGNGLRCVALHLSRLEKPGREEFVIDTDAGPRRCVVELESTSPPSAWVTTGLGQARLEGELSLESDGQTYHFTRVSVGNPHAIRFGPPERLEHIDVLGPRVSEQVPGGLNVEFATARDERCIDVVVWERGVGRTLACGTGAGATAVAAAVTGTAPFDTPITIGLPGGSLEARVAAGSLDVELRGPAKWVFSGEWIVDGEE